MTPRITATLAVCALAGGITAFGLARPASTPTAASAPAEATASTGMDHSTMGDSAAPAPAAGATPAPAAAPADGSVTIEGFAFTVSGTFAPGQTITVVNADGALHTMTADDGSFDTGAIESGTAVLLTLPTTPGTYSFFCGIHPSMKATITIAG